MNIQPKIGDVFYFFEENHRVYDKTKGSGPIYREHFRPRYIVGQEKQSWLVSRNADGKFPSKISKQHFLKKHYTAQQVDDRCWEEQHRYRICDLVNRCTIDELKQIAAILGYRT